MAMAATRRTGKRRIEWTRVAVVGAGPAGLATSKALARARVHHLVLERHLIASSWLTQRWDSFRLNTPNWMNRIPGPPLLGASGQFATADALAGALRRIAERLPVREQTEVLRAERAGPVWRLETETSTVVAAEVVVASGFQNTPRRPSFAAELPTAVTQLHAAEYRSAADVRGAVLVVGGGQSGVQIADDLLNAGRRVYLATSRVGRLPRRYRGRDAFEWLRDTGQLDLPADAADPAVIGSAPPQINGGRGTISYQHLAGRGATLLGRVIGCDGGRLTLETDIGGNVRFADESSRSVRTSWDNHAGDVRPLATPGEDPADDPAEHLHRLVGPASLDLAREHISTVIWATGFEPSTAWLPTDALGERARPQLPGLHVIGAPWLTHRSSANLYGIASDAERIVAAIRTPLQLAA